MLIIALIASILAIILGVRCALKLYTLAGKVRDMELDRVQDHITALWLAGDFYQVASHMERLDPGIATAIRSRLEKSQIPDREILLKLI
jgi:hypothetical protein